MLSPARLVLAVCGLVTSVTPTVYAQQAAQQQPGIVASEGARVDMSPTSQSDAATQSAPFARDDRWHLEFHPVVWFVGVSGEVKLPVDTGNNEEAAPVDADDLNITQTRVTPMGEANITRGNWLIMARGMGFGIDREQLVSTSGNVGDVSIVEGESVSSSVDALAFELAGGYRVINRDISPLTGGGYKLSTALYVMAGARVIDFEYSIEDAAGVSDSADATSVHPTAGLKFVADFYNDFTVHAEVNGGTSFFGDDSYGFDIVVGGQWRFVENVGLQIGYRALFFEVESGEDSNTFEWSDGALQGVYAGLTFSF